MMRMNAKLAIVLGALSLVFACGRGTAKTSSTGLYVSKEMAASFRVPAGWAEPKSWNPFKPKKGPVVRFDSPDAKASLTAGQAPYAGINCAAAAKEALAATTGAALSTDSEFELKANLETLLAGMGPTSSNGRRGVARYFCRAKSVVVVEAAADSSSFLARQGELEAILDSLNFESGGQQVAIRPPAAPAGPTFFQHTVRFRGQTLGQIAEWYTGEYDNWKKLSRYNDDTPVPNEALKVGREIKIPVELVVRQDPMPEPKRRKKPPPSTGKTTTQRPVTKKPTAPGETPAATQPKEAPAGPSEKASDEEVAETTDVPKPGEDEADEAEALPPVIGPR